ncbi:MAG: hypothetical protein HOM76_00070 [Flavobacteriaceae bacterium]|jgi:hydrogenase maturation factor|nr:hypothetical protein [Flavobacteriaceae bacterium]MBT5284223.1 hypothetical protein [Flavobacteriaceae bacterium]MBT5446205.1 hypothetical protein [Flavobacteriaceae bacterium]
MENWKNVKGYEGIYKVSDLGRVKSLTRSRVSEDRILNPSYNRDGYQKVVLSVDGVQKTVTIHSLVAEAFLGHKRDGLLSTGVVNHLDENKANNVLSNLEVVTQRENVIHSRTKLRPSGLPSNIKKIKSGKYTVQFSHGDSAKNSCWINRGTYISLEDAISARNQYIYELDNCKFQHLIIE